MPEPSESPSSSSRAPLRAAGARGAAARPPSRHARRVLVVEHEGSLRRQLCATLGSQGCEVSEAGSLAGARAALADGLPDVLVVEGTLPDGAGDDLIRSLPDGARRPKVIYISSQLCDAETVRALHGGLGTSVVLPKPVQPVELNLHILGLLSALDTPAEPLSVAGPLELLRADYRKRLPDQLRALADRLAACSEGDCPASEPLALAHRICGTSGSFGMSEVSDLAGEVEATLGRIVRSPDPLADPDALRVLGAALADMAGLVADPPAEAPAGPRPDPQPVARLVDERLLVVHPDPELFEGVRSNSEVSGLVACHARSEAEALAMALEKRASLVVIADQLPPGDDAFRLVRRLRALPDGVGVRVAVVTGDDHQTAQLMAARTPVELLAAGPMTAALCGELVRRLQQRSPRPPKVMIVDDDPHLAGLVAAALDTHGASAVVVRDPLDCMEALDRYQPDLLLLDLMMPVLSGLDLCRLVRASARWYDLPVVVLTARNEGEVRAIAYRAGVDDYLTKPLVDEELGTRVVRRAQRYRQEREARERDGLTGLLLRAPFLHRTQQLLSSGRRHHLPVSVAMVDIDHFKAVNDSYGHMVGDQVLVVVGRLLEQGMRAEDLCARWGGEEFALCLFGADAERAARALQRLQVAVSKVPFTGPTGQTFHVTFSAGVASSDSDPSELMRLLERADANLYEAKRSGRARVVS